MVSPYVVSSYDSRPPNGEDVSFSVVTFVDDSNGVTNFSGIAAKFIVPSGRVFVMRQLDLSVAFIFRVLPPYAVPTPADNFFLTNANGFPNTPTAPPLDPGDTGGGSPDCRLYIHINDAPTAYFNLPLPWLAFSDYIIPMFLPTKPGDLIKITVGRLINTTPASLYGGVPNNAQIILSGNLLSDTGLTSNDETLNNNPLPMRFT